MTLHKDLADGRWFTFTLAEQLGNVGAEFGRAIAARNRGDDVRFESAAARFYELMDLTVADPRWRSLRRRELARTAEICREALAAENEVEDVALEKYFMQFALLARAASM